MSTSTHLAHQALRPGLLPYSVEFTDIFERDAVLAEEAAVHDEVPLLAF